MRKIAILVVLAFVAVPAALAEDAGRPSALCKQRTAVGTSPSVALRRQRVRPLRLEARNRVTPAIGERLETVPCRDAPTRRSRRTHGGKTFAQVYGTGKHGNNAFGKCVSKKAKTLARGPAGHDDRRGQDVQGRAHVNGRSGLHEEVRRPHQRFREVRLENRARPAVRLCTVKGARPAGRGAAGCPSAPYTVARWP